MDDRNARRVSPTPPADEPRVEPSGGEGLGTLVTGIVEDLQNIVRGEVQLAKTELKEDASKIGKAVAMLAAGGILALVGFNFLMWTAIFLLDEWIEEIWI
ncbi:MAG: phage holin family protein, partial [Chloroflexota bacterium]|nr:phage holin family protein [Chloroflexota bacterium]